MRTVALMSLALVCASPALAAVSPGRAQAEAYILLDDCAATQNAATDAWNGDDPKGALEGLQKAQDVCRKASAKLRDTRFDKLDTQLAADGIDKMVEGLGKLEKAVRIEEASPAEARKEAKFGVILFRSGLAKMEAAKR
jgi:hypothetical protein